MGDLYITPEASRAWDALGLHPPSVFSAENVWKPPKPTWTAAFDETAYAFDKSLTVHKSGHLAGSKSMASIWACMKQLTEPDATLTSFITNIPWKSIGLKIPPDLPVGRSAIMPDEKNMVTCANITPQYAFVDLHIDHGKHGLTTVIGIDGKAAVKLWALYPPTEKKFAVYKRCLGENDMFHKAQPELELGSFVLTTDDQAIYLPPGCLHSTLTLRGGLTPGIEFMSCECLDVAVRVWDIPVSHFTMKTSDHWPLMDAIRLTLLNPERSSLGLTVLCIRIDKLKPGLTYRNRIRSLLVDLDIVCESCGQHSRDHRPKA
ncbi:hypothetical protein B0T11DRAFT_29697 [Plectosphaerella cucumerina]|uniref:JmjC domain-containing protein n=1 Tax=Plectosphaerella cucumerina TaxID=40658 RepID=A0A8K0X9Q6_9PEZI|nr:hypothetical protein B0T11DRAFT_29697 [Plectosphaerella cucumerina]